MTLRLHKLTMPGSLLLAGCLLASRGALAQQLGQKTYKSPEAAAAGLVSAVKAKEWDQLNDIVGFNVRAVASGDTATDRNDVEVFLKRYAQMHRFANGPDGKYYLIVGADNWSLPVPLAKSDKGWYFDGAYGEKEAHYREIGRNELNAIRVCILAVRAKQPPHADDKVSQSFGGYTYRALASDGKSVSLLAYPTIYRQSGVMTFVTASDGQVYEKDLGKDTATAAAAITDFKPDDSWHKVKAG